MKVSISVCVIFYRRRNRPRGPQGRFRRLFEITYLVMLLRLNEKGRLKVYGGRPEEG